MDVAPPPSTALGRLDASPRSFQVPPSFDEHRILIIDRDLQWARGLRRQLASTGGWADASIKVVSHGLEALIVAEQFHPHLAIIEVSWPRRSGESTAKHLRARAWGGACVIVSHCRQMDALPAPQPTRDIDFHFFENLSVEVLARIAPHLAQRRAFDLAQAAGTTQAWHMRASDWPKTGKSACLPAR